LCIINNINITERIFMKITTTITKAANLPNEVKRTIKSVDNANGTSLQGYVIATYAELKALFGAPSGPSGDGKVQHGWYLDIDGVICTIYDYKENLATRNPERWHVGGKSPLSVELVDSIVEPSRA
jgi:hypothetical protein